MNSPQKKCVAMNASGINNKVGKRAAGGRFASASTEEAVNAKFQQEQSAGTISDRAKHALTHRKVGQQGDSGSTEQTQA